MPALDLAAMRRILAVRLDNIGDTVMLTPALRALRQAAPKAHLTLLASPAGSRVGPLLRHVDEVAVHRALWQDASGSFPFDPEGQEALIRSLRAATYDAAFIFTSFSQSPHAAAYACYLAGIPVRVGQSKEFGGGVLSHAVPALPDDIHQVDRNLSLLEGTGVPLAGRELELRIPPRFRASAAHILARAGVTPGNPYILLAPGASCSARRYDPARFAHVARLLVSETGLPIAIAGSAADQPAAALICETAADPRVVSVAGETSVPELATLIAWSSLLIGNDSGPMHIADAFRRPMVITFAGTDLERQWQPRSAPAALLRRPTGCSPCYAFECPYNRECLDIAPQEIATNAVRLLVAGSRERETTPIEVNAS